MNRLLGSALIGALVLIIAACGGGAAPTQAPGGQQTQASGGQQTQAPGAATPQPPQGGGDNQSKARALVPPGSTEISQQTVGGAYTLTVSTTQTFEQVGAFLQAAIPGAGLTETGRFASGETLTVSFTNPDGGVVAISDPGQGIVILTISVGIS